MLAKPSSRSSLVMVMSLIGFLPSLEKTKPGVAGALIPALAQQRYNRCR
jgi:hypothetical protein